MDHIFPIKRTALTLAMMLFSSGSWVSARADVLVSYGFGTTAGTLAPDFTLPGVQATGFITDDLGATGLGAVKLNSGTGSEVLYHLAQKAGRNEPLSENPKIEVFYSSITITSGSNVQSLTIDTLSMRVARAGSDPGWRGFDIFHSATGFPGGVGTYAGSVSSNLARNVFTSPAATTHAFITPITVPANTSIEFRFMSFAPTTGEYVRMDDLTVNGFVTMPEPTAGLLAALAAIFATGRRGPRRAN